MRGEHVDALLDQLSNLPKAIAEPITTAWNAKEDLLDLLALARTHPNREQVRDLLYRFYQRCADAGLPELARLATTVETWWPQILAFLRTGITNAGSEEPTESSRPSPATRTASATPSTSDYEPEPRPPAKPAATSTLADSQKAPRVRRRGCTSNVCDPEPEKWSRPVDRVSGDLVIRS
jgi:Transposase